MPPSWTPSSLPTLTNRTYLVTGGNAGIGYHTVSHLAEHGARVYLGCRNIEKGTQALETIQASIPNAEIVLLQMDLLDLSSVVAATKKVLVTETQLHGLVNSAGIMATPFHTTKEGYESQWQTNYLSHWVLTWHLLPLFQKTAATTSVPEGTVRIVNVSSMGHAGALSEGINFADTSLKQAMTFRRYGQSKLANILHAKALHGKYGPISRSDVGKIWTVALHPGNVDTGLLEKSWGATMVPLLRLFGALIKPEEGAYDSLFAVAGKELKKEQSGMYFVPFGKEKLPSKNACDINLAETLWAWTEGEMRGRGVLE